MDTTDFRMYCSYYRKQAWLWWLKKVRKLDYTGRIPDEDRALRGYEGCYPVQKLLNRMELGPGDSILDVGCGKGLFLYYARRFPFRRVDGLEYSETLFRTAEQNCGALSDRRLHLICCDAREFPDYGAYNYFFFNNPFGKEIMEQVAERLVESCRARPRRLTVLYQFPFSLEVFQERGFVVEYERFPNAILTYSC